MFPSVQICFKSHYQEIALDNFPTNTWQITKIFSALQLTINHTQSTHKLKTPSMHSHPSEKFLFITALIDWRFQKPQKRDVSRKSFHLFFVVCPFDHNFSTWNLTTNYLAVRSFFQGGRCELFNGRWMKTFPRPSSDWQSSWLFFARFEKGFHSLSPHLKHSLIEIDWFEYVMHKERWEEMTWKPNVKKNPFSAIMYHACSCSRCCWLAFIIFN